MTDQKNDQLPQDEIKYEIPPEGSLGLLALGDVGLLAWREKRREYKQQKEKEQKNKAEE